MRDSPSSFGVTKEIAVGVKEYSRPVKKRITPRIPAQKASSGPSPLKPTAPCLVTFKKIIFLRPCKRVLANTVSARQIRVRLNFLKFFDAFFFLICEFWMASVPKSVDFLVLIYSYVYADHVIRL